MNKRPKTIFCDIDGTLVEHDPPGVASLPNRKMTPLPETIRVLEKWDAEGCRIILTTGRKESLRAVTVKQLSEVGIFYDKLIMGLGGGDRILINDNKSNGDQAAWALNPDRNQGLGDAVFYNLSNIAKIYFQAFSNKDLDLVRSLLDNDVTLVDWDGDHQGIDNVINHTRIIFDSVQDLRVDVIDTMRSENKVCGRLSIRSGGEHIPVVDIIEFNSKGKITGITAYRGN